MRATPTGIANLTPIQLLDLKRRFWKKVDRRSEDECWEWKAGCFYDNYGRFKIGSKNCKAHRVAYELTYGTAKNYLKILHGCDNKKCCNPKHLTENTQLQNIYDTLERSPLAANRKLSVNDVKYIRSSKLPRWQLAANLGVGKQMIDDVIARRRWGHIQ